MRFNSKFKKLIQVVKKLKKKPYESPETFEFEKIMNETANRAHSCFGSEYREFSAVDGGVSLVFHGHIYEPTYEYFAGGCDVYGVIDGEKQCLYSIGSKNVAAYKNVVIEHGSLDDVRKFIQENIKIGIAETLK